MSNRLELRPAVARSVGEIGEFSIGDTTYVLVNSPPLIRQVLVTQADAFEKSEFQLTS
jgi:hypothetical protein